MVNNLLRKSAGSKISGSLNYFDDFGRRIPPSMTEVVHKNSRRRFICVQPKINYSEIHARISRYLDAPNTISVREFKNRAEGLLEDLRNNRQTRNITAGVAVPFFLPKVSYPDIGTALETVYLPAVDNSYSEKFPNYEFVNYQLKTLSKRLSVTPLSRHEKLLQHMKDQVSVGYFFPCLLEYSVPAAIAQIEKLPDNFLLGGGFDICTAFVGCPDLLFRQDGYPPLIWLAGLTDKRIGIGYHFEAYGYNLTFNRRPHFDQAAEYWTSGLTVLG